ncbi:MAG: DUF4112 domain-containing protein [Prevotella sp.]|nr:DUF4112 domain-containing protein [Prevotella sp.]
MRNREEIKNRKEYAMLQTVAKYMDRYHIDGMIGLVPYVGDYFSAVALIPFAYVTLFVVKSVPLTLAVINNCLRDILIGMIPFMIGNIIDFFHKSNLQSLNMIIGYVEGDKETVKAVRRSALLSVIIMVILITLIVLMAILLVKLGAWIVSLF